ncbi:MAG: RDD family protein [Pirellulales bacterium]
MVDNSLGDADYYDRKDYADFGKRLLIMLIDSVVLLLIGAFLWAVFAFLWDIGVLQADASDKFWLVYLLAMWVYLAPIRRSEFGTVGYRMLDVKLVSARGGRPSLLNMTFRMLMWMFGPFNLVLDALWIGADSESQSLRDCYLGTYLVARNAVPIGRAPVHLTRYHAMGFTLAYPRVCRPRSES